MLSHHRPKFTWAINLQMKNYYLEITEKIGWPTGPEGTLQYWRERILLNGYLIGMLVCGIAVVFVSTRYQLQEKQFITILIELCGFLWTLIVLFLKGRIPYFARAVTVVALVYSASIITLYEVGPSSVASAEFVSVCVFSALLFGMPGTVTSIILIGITLSFFGIMIDRDYMSWGVDQLSMGRYPGWCLWMLLWATLTSVGSSIIFKGLDASIKKEKKLRNSLEELVQIRTRELKKTNENLTKENIQRKEAEKGKEKKILELKAALNEIKTLKGLLPICASCKKIRDDKGYWNQIESYIQRHSDAKFSHGICPECSDELYGDQNWYIEMKKGHQTE